MATNTADDVWRKIIKSTMPDGCWIWTGLISRGYPIVSVDSRQHQVHRYIHESETGEKLSRVRTTAGCGNPKCVRPDHRIPMKGSGYKKGPTRQPTPEGKRDKLTWRQVRAIRKAAATGANQYVLADKYGVSQATISLIVLGKSWIESAD